MFFLVMKYLPKNWNYIGRNSSATIRIRCALGTQNVIQRWYRSAFRTPWAVSFPMTRDFDVDCNTRIVFSRTWASLCEFRGDGADLWSFICWDTERSRAENRSRAPLVPDRRRVSRFSVITPTETPAKTEPAKKLRSTTITVVRL